MFNLQAIYTVARYEAKLLFRSWAFRIFTLLGLFILFWMNFAFGTKISNIPHFLNSLSGSLPMMNIKFNGVYQGIIAAFLATDFLKRDRRHDTTEVVFTRSYSNADYVLGKLIGILSVFAVLNLAVILQAAVFHLFPAPTPFAWQPYVYYTLLVSLPTLVFMIGASFLLINVLRSQAVVFVIMLGYSLLVLIVVGRNLFCLFDAYAWHQPMMFSDFIGMGNLDELLLLRGAYFLIGLSLIAATVLFTRRLRQSMVGTISAGAVFSLALIVGIGLGYRYLDGKFGDRQYRALLLEVSAGVADVPTANISRCQLDLKHKGDNIAVTAEITAINNTVSHLDSVLFTLNPGLSVAKLSGKSGELSYKRNHHLLWLKPAVPLDPGDSVSFELSYAGTIDDRYCYLDIADERYEGIFGMAMYTVPKKYGIVEPDYLHLTPETGWYPKSGLPQGAIFPRAAHHDYTQFALTVMVPRGLTVISQGEVTVDTVGSEHVYSFLTDRPLPQISLTAGTYETREITVDSITYTLHTLPGHDYFAPYFDSVGDTLSHIIRELKNGYEVALGLEYPFGRLSLVETPIQFHSYRRAWTLSQETVPPQVVYLPEMGTTGGGTDFRQMKRGSIRSQERANQADAPEVIQSGYFKNFVQTDLLGTRAASRGIRSDGDIEPHFEILSNYVSHNSYLASERWPVLNYAFESYLRDRVTPPEDIRGRQWRGLTTGEKANLALKKMSLADMVAGTDLPPEVANTAIENKGRYLLALLEAKTDPERFATEINSWLGDSRWRNITDDDLISFVDGLGYSNTEEMIDSWYYDTLLPGFAIEEMETYKVLDGERTRSQIKFRLSNPTDIDGLVEVSIRYSRREMDFRSWRDRGQDQSDYSRRILMPAQTVKEIGIVVDEPPAEVALETYVSQNIPSVIRERFRDLALRRDEQPFEGDLTEPIGGEPIETDTLVVDNEDAGFEIVAFTRENWLRRTLLGLFGSGQEPDPYIGLQFWDPPGIWLATTDQNYHGQFVHSAQFKKSGDGKSRVAWVAEFAKEGDYDVYYYNDGERPIPFRRHRNRRINRGEQNFVVYHEDGTEELTVDLNLAEEGWNYLGTYRFSSGENRVELTDKNEIGYVIADAIKWVKR